MPTLADCAVDRDNNLNLLRLLAAWAVLVSHAFPISRGPDAEQPLEGVLGSTLGELAVWMFFLVSGMLITASWERRSSLGGFCWARVLRIVPGLLVSLLLVALVLGPWVCEMPLSEYLLNSETWTFVARNTLMVSPQYSLPGVFIENPYPMVEGSIWTLWHEVVCYVGVVVLGMAGLFSRPRLALGGALLLGLLIAAGDHAGHSLHPKVDQTLRLAVPFSLGATTWLWRQRVPISAPVAVVVSGLAWLALDSPLQDLGIQLGLLAWTLLLSYGIGGHIRAFNRVGDYSYGLYIYAFPVQGLVQHFDKGLLPRENVLWSTALTLPIAIASWHLIERPALGLKTRFALRRPDA